MFPFFFIIYIFMLSIFVIYSCDRIKQFEIFYECLKEMPGYDECQKILVVDGEESNIYPNDFQVILCKRPKKHFNWALAWDLGIKNSIYDKIWYLDSDRILPTNYLKTLYEEIEEDCFVYSSQIVSMKENIALETARKCRKDPYLYWDYYKEDWRLPNPPNMEFLSMGKNPMSGNTGFTKNTFLKSGGLDYSFEGPALADTDYYYKTYLKRFKFKTIPCLELHLKHEYSIHITDREYMYMYNALKVCKKYGLKPSVRLAERLKASNVDPSFMKYDIDTFMLKCKNNKIKSF